MGLFSRHIYNLSRDGELRAQVEAPSAKQALLTFTLRSGFGRNAIQGFVRLPDGGGSAIIAGNQWWARRADADSTEYAPPLQ